MFLFFQVVALSAVDMAGRFISRPPLTFVYVPRQVKTGSKTSLRKITVMQT
jgi:hypothetical protein